MTAVDGSWTRAELETFLAEALVPIRLGCRHPGGGLWMVALWYRHADGAFQCATAADSQLASFLRRDGTVCFDVSTNAPPYMGVRGSGEATLAPDDRKDTLRTLLERYLGGTDSQLAALLLDETRDELRVTVEPTRLYTWDFTERMEGLASAPARENAAPVSPKHRGEPE